MMSCRGRAAAQRELQMVRIPIRSRVPMPAWAAAGLITIVSAISSLLVEPYTSGGLELAKAVN